MQHELIKFFKYEHLPKHLADFSKNFYDLALYMDSTLKNGTEKDMGMRKLLEAKDCFVRANL
jgi:hypothetical protein